MRIPRIGVGFVSNGLILAGNREGVMRDLRTFLPVEDQFSSK